MTMPQAPLTPQDGTITLPPDRDLAAMVNSILQDSTVPHPAVKRLAHEELLGRMVYVHDTAQRLKVALEREQADAKAAVATAERFIPTADLESYVAVKYPKARHVP